MALRVMFDTNAYDAILEAGDLTYLQDRIAAGQLVVVTTHIQEDEIRQINKKNRQRHLLDLFRALQNRHISTSAALWGESKWGQANWVGETQKETLSDIQRYKHTPSRDDILGATAAEHCDLLITQDRKFAARLNASGQSCQAVSYGEFREIIGSKK